MDQVSEGIGRVEPARAAVKRTTPLGRAIIAADRAIYRAAKRWLLLANSIFFVHVALLVLAPVLRASGHEGAARPIYGFNGFFCHQRPSHSFSLLGESVPSGERCTAVYAALLLAGLAFAFLRGRLQAPRLIDLVLLALPMVIDGGAQTFGLWESTAASRVISGGLFGAAMGWWLLFWLEGGFARMRGQIEALFARLVAEGRARAL